MKGGATVLAIVAMVVLTCGVRVGAGAPVQDPAAGQNKEAAAPQSGGAIPLTECLTIGFKTRYFFDSHSSYEFGNPLPPYQAPLSRLEFPLDSWWVGAELRASFPRFSIGAEALTNASSEADGRMRDSDWTDGERPDLKTIYSESKCHLSPSCMLSTDVDLKISDWLCLPSWLDLRPVAGFRWQYFNFLAHDGLQVYPTGLYPPVPLPGDTLRFEQTYWHYFGGARAALDLGKPLMLNSLTALLQFDWAYVAGHNEDHHLLRGLRYTYEDTSGDAWHATAGLRGGLYKQLTLALEAEFLQLSTTGSHRLVDRLYEVDMEWKNGVRVWSRQDSVSLTLAYSF